MRQVQHHLHSDVLCVYHLFCLPPPFFLKPPSAFSTLKYISYYGNSDIIGGAEVSNIYKDSLKPLYLLV